MSKIFKITFFDIFRSQGSWILKGLKFKDYFWGTLVAFILPKQKIEDSFPQPIRKILIIRPGGIGDAVFLLLILKNLKAKGIFIDILCESRNAEVFSSQGYSVFFYNQLGSLGRVLKNSYDVVIDTEQWHYSSAIMSYFSKTNYRIGFATRPLRAKLFNKQVAYGDNDYELDNFLRLFEGLIPSENEIKDINNSFDISQNLKAWASGEILKESVTIFLGSSIALRRFSKDRILDVIKGLLVKGLCPVLLGGKDVVGMANQILEEDRSKKILSFVGKVSLAESAALIQRSQEFIGPDSGLMHLACAVGTPVVAVFGPGNLKKWQPKGERHKVIIENGSRLYVTRFGYTIPAA